MRCGIRDTVGVQVGRGKGLAGWVGFERIAEIYGRIKNRTLRTEGYGTQKRPSGPRGGHPPDVRTACVEIGWPDI